MSQKFDARLWAVFRMPGDYIVLESLAYTHDECVARYLYWRGKTLERHADTLQAAGMYGLSTQQFALWEDEKRKELARAHMVRVMET